MKALGIALALVVLATCGPKLRITPSDAPVPWQRSGVDWSAPPKLPAPLPFAAPMVKVSTLANGVRVIVVANDRLPLVAIKAVYTAAGSREDGDRPGLASLTAELLDEHVDVPGARLDSHIATDYASLDVIAPSGRLRDAIVGIANASRLPQLDDAVVARVRGERVAELEQRRERPRTIAAQIFDRVVFGAHPYALPAEGRAEIVAKLTAADVKAFMARAYRPTALTVIVAGNVDASNVVRLVEAELGGWQAPTTVTAAPTATAYAPQLAIVDLPGAKQSVVLVGRRAEPAGKPAQLAGDVATSIVGGGVGARLDRKLHDELALTLGASASFWRGRWAGSWALATTFATDKTLTGIRAALAVIEAARSDVTADELARAKTNLLAAAQQSFETLAGTVRALERVEVQALPADWYATYTNRLAAITLADVRAAATWQELSIVVVGDRARLEPVLGELGLPIVHYDRDGIVVR